MSVIPAGDRVSGKGLLKRHHQRMQRYLGTAGWLIGDIVRVVGIRLLGLFGLSFAAVGARVVAFGGLIAYIHGKTSPEAAMTKWLRFMPPASEMLPWVTVIFAAALGMGVLGLAEARYRVRLSMIYSMSAMRRALTVLATHGEELAYMWKRSPTYMTRLVAADSFVLVRAAMPLISSIPPLVQFLTTIGILVAVSWRMALLIFVFSVCYMVPYVQMNRQIIRMARRERGRGGASLANGVDTLIRRLRYPQFRGTIADRSIESLLASDAMRDRLQLAEENLVNRYAVHLLNSLFLSLFLVAFIVGLDWLSPKSVAMGVVAYAVVLVHAFHAGNHLTSRLTIFNRFFLRFDRYVELLRHPEWRTARPPRAIAPRGEIVLRVVQAADPLPQSRPRVTLKAGKHYVVLQPEPLSILNLDPWFANLGCKRLLADGDVFIAPLKRDLPDVPLRELIAGGGRTGLEGDGAMQRLLSLPWMKDWIASLPLGLDTPFVTVREEASRPAVFALMVAPALFDPPGVVAVRAEFWLAVPEQERAEVMACLPDSVWLLATDMPQTGLAIGADFYIIASTAGVRGIGTQPWLAETLKANPSLFGAESSGAEGPDLGGDAELEDGEMRD